MKISEIIDYDDPIISIDFIRSNDIVKFDKFYDNILNISNNFNIPSAFFADDIRIEMLEYANELSKNIIIIFNPEEQWHLKADKLVNYLR